jgi:hypothetical protein
MDNEFGGPRAPLITLLAAIFLLATAGAYILAHVLLPSDGTALDFQTEPPPSGLALNPWRPGQSPFQPGDVLLAIDGHPLDDWITGRAASPGASPSTYRIERAGQSIDLVVPLGPYDALAALGSNWAFAAALVYLFAVGAVVFARRPVLPSARALFLVSAAVLASSTVYYLGLQARDLRYGWLLALWAWGSIALFGVALGGLLHFTLVFPRVRPALARRPAWLVLVYAGVWLPYLVLVALGWPSAASAASRLSLLLRSTSGISAVYFLLVLASSLWAYRHASSQVERRQIRWTVWGIFVAEVPWLATDVAPNLFGRPSLLPPQLLGLFWVAIPATIAIAILRERLFDIDVIIRRTLVYSLLTATLAVIYFGSVVLFQALLAAVPGQNQSALATVLSTLTIAALFRPLRTRAQRIIDLRFYRRQYDAAQALNGFSASLREHVNLDQLSERLVDVVDETMRPAHVSLWIRPRVDDSSHSNP